MLRLDDCIGRPEAGAKAVRLAQARAAGLRVLDGWVVLPGEEVGDVSDLGELLIVRSSSVVEDAAGASAAGVFESVANVVRQNVAGAVERVRASADSEAARAYFRGAAPPLAVLIQPMARAPKLAVAMTGEGGFLVEERNAGEPEWGDVEARRVTEGPLFELLRSLETLIGGPVDAELAELTVLQVRPRARGPLEASDDAFAAFTEPGRWKLDAEHNPRPLSAAQAGLVELVEELGVGPRQRVVAGYLYAGAPRGTSPLPLADLRRRFDDELVPDCRARLQAAEGLEGALAAYAHVYRRYVGEVAPSVSRARTQLDQFLRMNLREPLSLHGDLLGGVGGAPLQRDQALWELQHDRDKLPQYLADFGAWSPAWDVAVPPDDEAVDRVLAVQIPVEPRLAHERAAAAAEAAAHAMLERLDRMARRAFKALLPAVRAAVEVGEDDDVLFFEAQRLVRRALLSLNIADIFDMGLAEVRKGIYVRRPPPPATSPPEIIEDGRPIRRLPPPKQVLRGHATSGQARGRATRHPEPDTVWVVDAILPSLAYLLPRCRALVTAHGGATSHGATLAREYGIPAVLGARGAESIAEGAELFVDGAGGRVLLLA
jgi:phosphohistidine swiveling domain-containing protein